MFTAKMLRHACALALLGSPLAAMAAPSTDPLFTFGLLGSYDNFKFEGGSDSDKEHLGQGGVFANFGATADHLTGGPWSEWVSTRDLREEAGALPEALDGDRDVAELVRLVERVTA